MDTYPTVTHEDIEVALVKAALRNAWVEFEVNGARDRISWSEARAEWDAADMGDGVTIHAVGPVNSVLDI